ARRGRARGCGRHRLDGHALARELRGVPAHGPRARLSPAPRPPAMPAPFGAFAALRHRNFRLLWSGQLVSMAGSMMQNAAILWHVSLLVPAGQRGLALGMVGLVRIVPIVAFSLISGVAADALDRRKLMLVTQTGMTISA